MKLIFVSSEVWKLFMQKIDHIYEYVNAQAQRETAAQPDPSKEWIDNDEACEILKVSKRTMQRLRSKGQITYSLRGGVVRYTRGEIDRAMNGRTFRSTTERESMRKNKEGEL
jgi:hypothetical protein